MLFKVRRRKCTQLWVSCRWEGDRRNFLDLSLKLVNLSRLCNLFFGTRAFDSFWRFAILFCFIIRVDGHVASGTLQLLDKVLHLLLLGRLWFRFEHLPLLIFWNDNVTLGMIPDIDPFNLIGLTVIQELVSVESFLAKQADLFISPDFLWVVTLFLYFLLQLVDHILKIACISLTLLSRLQEEFALMIKICLHVFLNSYLIIDRLNK